MSHTSSLKQLVFTLAFSALATALPVAAQTIPNDAKATCTVAPAVFKTWFQSGAPSLNGVVNPANSVSFPNVPNCSFYQWSMQMFLWLTSPAPATYGGGGGRIMDSPAFYDVSPPDAGGNRTFVTHTPGFIRTLGVRVAQVGPHGLPVIFDRNHHLLEVAPARLAANGRPLVVNQAGASVEMDRVRVGTNGKAVFVNRAGVTIPNAKPLLPIKLNPITTVTKIVSGGSIIFVNGLGVVIPVEQGQADNSVLESQGGSLVYYALMVNDVYAYFLTGSKDNRFSPAATLFPTNAAQLKQITDFAKAQSPSKTFPDPNALAVEIKTSWVLASSLPGNGSGYITMKASVPTYNTALATKWTPAGNKTELLAMVGMHVVGSAAGHPEMIWATFEHTGNAPNAAYSYVNTAGVTKSVPQSTAGTWVFAKSSSAGPFNSPNMTFVAPNIVATGAKIAPGDTLRTNAWGADATHRPNPADATVAASNTEIIAINNSVRGMLPAGDVRASYFTTGATWTINGAPPIGSFTGSITNGAEVGTSEMANSTMETYQQGFNCFGCHARGAGTLNPNLPSSVNSNPLSHVYDNLKPLF